MIEPKIELDDSFRLGPLEQLKDGLPDDLKLRIGKRLAAELGRRVRNASLTADGEALDPNSIDWEKFKQESLSYAAPLVATGAMTEPNAWDVKIVDGGIELHLSGEHREKWDNIIEAAESQGLNWDRAWEFGSAEAAIVMDEIRTWIKQQLGITVFESDAEFGLD